MKGIVLFSFAAVGLLAVGRPVSELEFTKPDRRWLWGGFGFHNSEATMTPLMSDEFRDQRVLKTYREISPSYARVFAGFADWTREAMDRFADYYDAAFRFSGTTLYLAPGRMPAILKDFDAAKYAEAVAERLAYLVRERKLTKIRYYTPSNELSVGTEYVWFESHWDVYRRICEELVLAFRRHGLDIGLMTTDSANPERIPHIEWATRNINDLTDTYCWHVYESVLKPGDLSLYGKYHAYFTNVVAIAGRREKRISIGEYGFQGPNPDFIDRSKAVMRDDGNYSYRNPREAPLAAMARAEMGLAAMNAGCLHAVTWTMFDYPDPFLREDGDTQAEKARYDVARFSGFGLDVRYNKNGLVKWCDDEHDYSSRPDLYTMGYLAKLFRKGARVLAWQSSDPTLRAGGVTNPDGSCSLAILNWGEAKTVSVRLDHPISRPFRMYAYDSAAVPTNAFNDLQRCAGTLERGADGRFAVALPAKAMVFLTSDYVVRTPSEVETIGVRNGTLSWKPCADPEHVYYRVYANGRQIASTVATSLRVTDGALRHTVTSVDRWGNEGAGGQQP